jgi:hypothetical protein
MPIRHAVEILPGLQDLLDLREVMLAAGESNEAVDAYMAQLNEYAFDQANAQMRADGKTEAEIVRFWTVDMHPGRDDPNSTDFDAVTGELYRS